MTNHGPVLPLWLCETCDRPWPCATRRTELLGECERISLAYYMNLCLISAGQDMSWAPADVLRRRFIGWLP
ncbi:hypothetical protein FHG89_18335 [Micromonospora orduensis]|uniref:Flavin reductase n=1 Tax=Micromonospora orduensis TaxID=1420891 RepID=A0A5C4QNW6_9ACTN|nr:hypothetical protein [Micromonospora orduensis]TNH27278.1 hypothetical protein FHG89_18335 [Micromonospora orduensis]